MGKYSDALLASSTAQPMASKYGVSMLEGKSPEKEEDTFLDPNIVKRGMLLPLGQTKEGGYEPAIPQFLIDIAKNPILHGEPYTERDVTNIAGAVGIPALRGIGGTGTKQVTRGVTRKQVKEAPTTKTLKTEAQDLYKTVEKSDAVVSPESYQAALSGIEAKIYEQGYDAALHPKAAAALKAMGRRGSQGMSMKDMSIARRLAKNAKNSIDKDEARIGRSIVDELDSYMQRLGDEDLISGSAAGISQTLKQADSIWAQASKSQMLDKAMEAAKATASGFENGLRSEFRKILKDNRKREFLSEAEQAAMQKVVDGSVPTNVLKGIGKFGPSPGGGGNALMAFLAGSGGYAVGGVPGMLAVGATGYGAKKGAQALTQRAAESARATVAGVRPQAQTVAVGTQGLPRTLGAQAAFAEGNNVKVTPKRGVEYYASAEENSSRSVFGPKKVDQMAQFVSAFKDNPEQMATMESIVFDDLRNAVVRDGEVKPRLLDRWVDRFSGVLNEIPDVRDKISNLEDAYASLLPRMAVLNDRKVEEEDNALDVIMSDVQVGDIETALSNPKMMRQIVNKTGGDKGATHALLRSVWEGVETGDAEDIKDFIGDNKRSLIAISGGPYLKNIEFLAEKVSMGADDTNINILFDTALYDPEIARDLANAIKFPASVPAKNRMKKHLFNLGMGGEDDG